MWNRRSFDEDVRCRETGFRSQRQTRRNAVDWVERIPLAETRNYVQCVMENLQVYRARFGGTLATVEPNLHRADPGGCRDSVRM
jgi:hypothetical protein